MRRIIAVCLLVAVGACSAGSRGFTPAAISPQGFDRPDSIAKYPIKIENDTGATLRQFTDSRYCLTAAPDAADIPSHQSMVVTVEIDRSKCTYSASFVMRFHEQGAPKTTFGSLAFTYIGPNKRYRFGTTKFKGIGFNGLCGEHRGLTFKLFEGKPPTPGCETWRPGAVTSHVSRSFSLTIENASGVSLSGLTKSSYCMSSTPGGALPAGPTTYTVTTFGRSWLCDYDADFTVYYWVSGSPLTDVVSVNWVYEAPGTRVYPAGFHGFCAARLSETHVRITKC